MANVKFGKWKFSEKELLTNIKAAAQRGEEELNSAPRADSAVYDKSSNMIFIYLTNGSLFGFPPRLIKELKDASLDEIAQVTLMPLGDALHWDDLDAHYTLVGLLNGAFGTKAWMKELGRKGGSVSTGAKAVAARINGARGGRPRKESSHYQEIRCDLCGSSDFLRDKTFVSPKLRHPSLISLDKLDELASYITEPLERKNRRIVDVAVSPNNEPFQVIGRNNLKVLGLEN